MPAEDGVTLAKLKAPLPGLVGCFNEKFPEFIQKMLCFTLSAMPVKILRVPLFLGSTQLGKGTRDLIFLGRGLSQKGYCHDGRCSMHPDGRSKNNETPSSLLFDPLDRYARSAL